MQKNTGTCQDWWLSGKTKCKYYEKGKRKGVQTRCFSLSNSFPYVLSFTTHKVASAHVINSTSLVSVDCAQREICKIVRCFKAIFFRQTFFPVQSHYEMAPFCSVPSVPLYFLCPLPFYLRGCCQTKRSTVFLTFLQVTDRGRGRGRIFLSFFPPRASIILYALKNRVA